VSFASGNNCFDKKDMRSSTPVYSAAIGVMYLRNNV
jgi:hypothetical protein